MVKDAVTKFDFTNTMTSRTLHNMTSYHLSLACDTLYFDTLRGTLPRSRDYFNQSINDLIGKGILQRLSTYVWLNILKHSNLSMIDLRILVQEENLTLPGHKNWVILQIILFPPKTLLKSQVQASCFVLWPIGTPDLTRIHASLKRRMLLKG